MFLKTGREKIEKGKETSSENNRNSKALKMSEKCSSAMGKSVFCIKQRTTKPTRLLLKSKLPSPLEGPSALEDCHSSSSCFYLMGQFGGLARTWLKHVAKCLVASTCHGSAVFTFKWIFILLKYLLYCGELKYFPILPMRCCGKISSVFLMKIVLEVYFMGAVLSITQLFIHLEK
jgi:hypothetical protein